MVVDAATYRSFEFGEGEAMADRESPTQNPPPPPEPPVSARLDSVAVIHDLAVRRRPTCERLEQAIDEYLHDQWGKKHNRLPHCDDSHETCPCGRPPGDAIKKEVDLVILLDSSGSMSGAALAVSNAAEEALAAAAKECPSDLRAAFLVVDGAKPIAAGSPGANPPGDLGDITLILAGTPFKQSHQQYLEGIGSTGPFKQDEAQPVGDPTYPGEEGADAIADLCNFYDWRPDACRAIFYVSDTKLDGYSAFDAAAAANAQAAASANGVVLFAHHIGPASPITPEIQNYFDMCNPTGGSVYLGPVDVEKYKVLLREAVCKACGSECKQLKLPTIEPCVSIVWGDSDCDCFETDDVETAIVTICNCYSNVAFTDVHIAYFTVTLFDGSPVPLLPDGTPSVSIHPVGPVCFGDIGPCRPGAVNCVSREIVIRTRGAKSGPYKLLVRGICYQVVLSRQHEECFRLTLCAD
jgi:hypothetical protein